ncbi:MAG TPA: glycosyltransferase [Vicinamibacterales bacterium]|nr:glycosyltransferase [Vicinamibacterales bacterium]
MSRCAAERRVFFVEEPEYGGDAPPHLTIRASGLVTVIVPQLPHGCADPISEQRGLIDQLIQRADIRDRVLWYYTPMALEFTRHLQARAIVYDCMDELSAFKNAPSALRDLDTELMRRSSLVLTGGQSIFESRQHAHPNIHPFPSSVDVPHFAQARSHVTDPPDQAAIARPRLGFFGVIDERMDLALLAGVADLRPGWQIVMIGPVVKIDPATLPQRPNIHYLGGKTYDELPSYIAGWDVALLPFARNEATRFISPTKTPEYMAAGKPVVSTPIPDVVRPYGEQGFVRVADDVAAFVAACDEAMDEDPVARNRRSDAFLKQTSWDLTWGRIRHLLEAAGGEPQHSTLSVDTAIHA